VRQLTDSKHWLRPLVWRGVAALTLAAYSLLTLACASSIVFGIWYGLVTVGLIGSALGVYCASELRVLVIWVRSPEPTTPPVEPSWHVLICASVFVALAAGTRFVWGP